MTQMIFKIYYQFDGPTKEKQHIVKKSKVSIIESLGRINEELPVIIDDPNAVITVEEFSQKENNENNTRKLTVESSLSEEYIAGAVQRTVDGLGLKQMPINSKILLSL